MRSLLVAMKVSVLLNWLSHRKGENVKENKRELIEAPSVCTFFEKCPDW